MDQSQHVERAFLLLERGPITAVAAFFVVAFFGLLMLYLRETEKSRANVQRLLKHHVEELAELNRQHAERFERLAEAERTRAIKSELVIANFVEVVDELAIRRPRRRGPAHTPVPRLPGGDDE